MNLNNRHEANNALKQLRTMRRRRERLEDAAEDRIAKQRESLVAKTAPLLAQEKELVDSLEVYYRAQRQAGQQHIKLQDGVIGERRVPRVEVPKSAVAKAPRGVVTMKKTINKTALRRRPDIMEKLGARLVRPLRFYAITNDENAEK